MTTELPTVLSRHITSEGDVVYERTPDGGLRVRLVRRVTAGVVAESHPAVPAPRALTRCA